MDLAWSYQSLVILVYMCYDLLGSYWRRPASAIAPREKLHKMDKSSLPSTKLRPTPYVRAYRGCGGVELNQSQSLLNHTKCHRYENPGRGGNILGGTL